MKELQKWIKIGGIDVPVIIENGITFYPISFISENVLARSNAIITKKEKEIYINELKSFEIRFGEKNIQKTNCISEHGLINRLKNTHISRLSKEQRISQNVLHSHLKIDLISDLPLFIDKISDTNMYDRYTLDLIVQYLNEDENEGCQLQLCGGCVKYYPLSQKFFPIDGRNSEGFAKSCHVCLGRTSFFRSEDPIINKMIRQAGVDIFIAYQNDEIHKIYAAYLSDELNFLPDCYDNRDSYFKIVKKLYDSNEISIDEINYQILKEKYKLNNFRENQVNDLHIHLFGEDCVYYPWKYPNLVIGKNGHTVDSAITILGNFIKENNIVIEDIFSYKYGSLINSARIKTSDLLGLIVYYYNNEYPGYKFKIKSGKYYKNEKNLLFDLKYLIEVELGIEIIKIPLHLTKTSLRRCSAALYNFIIGNKNRNLFQWIDILYPNMFTEEDFDIHFYRDDFDSIEESQIHDILISSRKNIFYNSRNTNRTITIWGMQPDWIAIGEEKCWLIEYFGMYTKHTYNNMVMEYKIKTDEKINKYNQLVNYGHIFLYPDDLKDNFSGIKEKIQIIK